MYEKKLKLRQPEPETIYISKAERYELIALLAKSIQDTKLLKLPEKNTHPTTH